MFNSRTFGAPKTSQEIRQSFKVAYKINHRNFLRTSGGVHDSIHSELLNAMSSFSLAYKPASFSNVDRHLLKYHEKNDFQQIQIRT